MDPIVHFWRSKIHKEIGPDIRAANSSSASAALVMLTQHSDSRRPIIYNQGGCRAHKHQSELVVIVVLGHTYVYVCPFVYRGDTGRVMVTLNDKRRFKGLIPPESPVQSDLAAGAFEQINRGAPEVHTWSALS